MADFGTLKSQLAKVAPSNTALSAYSVTNTAAASCPTVGTAWQAHSDLPPVVNPDLCACMVKSLSCVGDSGLTGEQIGDVFGFVCGADAKACAGVKRDPSTGTYGAYSMCDGAQQVSFVVDQYFKNQKKATTACDFDGKFKVVTPASSSGNCAALVSAAGTAGTGKVTAGVSGTGTAASASGSATGSGNAAVGTVVPQFSFGMLQMGLYVMVAGLTGAGMILL